MGDPTVTPSKAPASRTTRRTRPAPGNGGIVGNGVSTVDEGGGQGNAPAGNVPQAQGGDVGGDTGKVDAGGGARPATATVPSVVNLHLGEAQSRLNGAGLGVSVSHRAVTDRAQDDVVLGQDPGERTTVNVGSTVRLTVGQLGTVAVPSVVDQSRGSAERQVNDAGLKSSVSYQKVDDPELDDVVLSQSPSGGAQAKAGDTVNLVVGQINTVQVPPVVKLAVAEAQRQLHGVKLRASVTQQTVQDKAQDGIVLGQEAAAGTTVDVGTTVALTVGHYVEVGPKVPSVVGLALADAQKRLEDLKLKWTVAYRTSTSNGARDGIVAAQGTAPGTSVPVGFTVDLTVDRVQAVTTCTVPSTSGLTLSQARAKLEAAGFTASPTYQAVTDPAQRDLVLSQSPSAGTTRSRPCGTVALAVGQVQAVAKVAVPSVVGQSQAAAQSQIEGAGLRMSATTVDVPDQTKNATVVGQTPASGTQVVPGSTVSVTVGHYVPGLG